MLRFALIALIGGWLAVVLTRRIRGLGMAGNIALGAIGTLVGAYLLRAVGIAAGRGFLPSVGVAVLGAFVVLMVVGAITGRGPLGRRFRRLPP